MIGSFAVVYGMKNDDSKGKPKEEKKIEEKKIEKEGIAPEFKFLFPSPGEKLAGKFEIKGEVKNASKVEFYLSKTTPI